LKKELVTFNLYILTSLKKFFDLILLDTTRVLNVRFLSGYRFGFGNVGDPINDDIYFDTFKSSYLWSTPEKNSKFHFFMLFNTFKYKIDQYLDLLDFNSIKFKYENSRIHVYLNDFFVYDIRIKDVFILSKFIKKNKKVVYIKYDNITSSDGYDIDQFLFGLARNQTGEINYRNDGLITSYFEEYNNIDEIIEITSITNNGKKTKNMYNIKSESSGNISSLYTNTLQIERGSDLFRIISEKWNINIPLGCDYQVINLILNSGP